MLLALHILEVKNRHLIGQTQCPNPCQRLLAFLEAIRATISQHHPGKIRCHAWIKNLSIYLQLQQTGGKTDNPLGRYRPARCENSNSTRCLLNPNLGFVEPAPPGKDKTSSPDHKYLHTSTTPTNRGRKRWSPDRYRPAQCGNPNATGFLLNPNLRCINPAPPGEDKMPSPHQTSLHTSTTPANRGRKRWSLASIPPRKV